MKLNLVYLIETLVNMGLTVYITYNLVVQDKIVMYLGLMLGIFLLTSIQGMILKEIEVQTLISAYEDLKK